MQSADMADGEGDWDTAPETEFQILKQDIGKFVLVLDTSGSMRGSRFEQLQQSTMRWIKHDIDSGSLLGIVSFRYGLDILTLAAWAWKQYENLLLYLVMMLLKNNQ